MQRGTLDRYLAGDRNGAASQLIKNYIPLAISIAKKWSSRHTWVGISLDDCIEDALYTLTITIYEGNLKDTGIIAYVSSRIWLSLNRLIARKKSHGVIPIRRLESVKERESLPSFTSLNNIDESPLHRSERGINDILQSLAQTPFKQIEFDDLLQFCRLIPIERRIVKMIMEGKTQSEIGEELGFCKQRISQFLANIREKITEHIHA